MNFLNNMPIGRKMFAAFALVLTAILVMGGVVGMNLMHISHMGETRRLENKISQLTNVAEFRVAKQENAMRGFLLTNNPYYLERLETHRALFKASLEEARGLMNADRDVDAAAAEAAGDAWFAKVVTAGTAMMRDPAQRTQAQALVAPDGIADGMIKPLEEAVDAMKSKNVAALNDAIKAQTAATSAAIMSLVVGIVTAVSLSLILGIVMSGSIASSILALIGEMKRLVGGDTTIAVPQATRKDEVGQMGVALIAFRDAAIEKNRIEGEALANRSQSEVERAANEAEKARTAQEDAISIGALADGLSAIAAGDLTHRFVAQVPPRAEQLKTDFNAAVTQLQDTISVVVTNVSAIRSGSGEISQAADDLSRRTEQQAASLEETAAALDEITATVNRTASGARQASETVQAAKGDAETSGNVVRDAVTAMGAIEKSSQEISQIIGVIDEIAFQTNLLALNAGVEAARAGDAGRGFAVVASEVRALAQRSAEAAKEIKVLISASSTQVKTGVSLVGQTGEALQRIVSRVAEIDGLVSEIAASAQEQATGLQQVNTAVNQMDQVTQQNAAMVEESTAASHSLSQEAESLAQSVSRFQIGAQTAQPIRSAPRPAPRAVQFAPSAHRPVAAMRPTGHGGAARRPEPVAAADGWEEF